MRDPDGTVVASAPKAEVGISSLGLLTGHLQAKRLSLIGAAMAVRVERDGQLTIFAGADKRPIARTPLLAAAGDPPKGPAAPPAAAARAKPKTATGAPPKTPAIAGTGAAAAQNAPDVWTTLLGWLDALDVLGPDGGDLTEIGVKNGSLVVDDTRTFVDANPAASALLGYARGEQFDWVRGNFRGSRPDVPELLRAARTIAGKDVDLVAVSR